MLKSISQVQEAVRLRLLAARRDQQRLRRAALHPHALHGRPDGARRARQVQDQVEALHGDADQGMVALARRAPIGAYRYDVHKIFGFFDPLPPCPHLELIYTVKFMQPPLPRPPLFHESLTPLKCADVFLLVTLTASLSFHNDCNCSSLTIGRLLVRNHFVCSREGGERATPVTEFAIQIFFPPTSNEEISNSETSLIHENNTYSA